MAFGERQFAKEDHGMNQTLDVAEFCASLKRLTSNRRFVVAFSGGLDSRVLLHLMECCIEAGAPWEVCAVHVDHGLQADSERWARWCRRTSGVSFFCEPVSLGKTGNVEARAREARYKALGKYVDEKSVLLTAHHQDDQAETFLLQLFRGAGPAGLAGMPAVKSFGLGVLLRPLLGFSRQTLLQYARRHRLEWLEDPSNISANFDRNFLRVQVLPLLRRRWSAVSQTIGRSAAHCAQMLECLNDFIVADFESVVTEDVAVIRLEGLRRLSSARQRYVLRHWFSLLGWRPPSERKLEAMRVMFCQARADAQPHAAWNGHELRRFSDRLYAMAPQVVLDPAWEATWDGQSVLCLPGDLGVLQLEQSLEWPGPFLVRFRREGDRIQVGAHSRSLKQFFQKSHIPPWQRDRVPLIFYEGRCVAVGVPLAS